MIEEQVQENLNTLRKYEIRKERASNLARLTWVNKAYIESHIHQAIVIEKQSIGLAIWRMENKKEVHDE